MKVEVFATFSRLPIPKLWLLLSHTTGYNKSYIMIKTYNIFVGQVNKKQNLYLVNLFCSFIRKTVIHIICLFGPARL